MYESRYSRRRGVRSFIGSITRPHVAKPRLRWVPLLVIFIYILYVLSYKLQTAFTITPGPNDSADSTPHADSAQGYQEDILFDNGHPQPIESLPFVEPIATSIPVPETPSTDTPLHPAQTETADTLLVSADPAQASTVFDFSEDDVRRIPTCSQVSVDTLKALQKTKSTSVSTFFNGKLIAKGVSLAPPAKICILVAVPQRFPASKLFPDSPIQEKWPDTVHLFLRSPSVRFSIPPLRSLPSQANAHQLFSTKAILYFAEIELRDQGVYHIDVENEAPNWMWAMHGWREASPELRESNQQFLTRMRSLSAMENYTAAAQVNKLLHNPVPVSASQKYPAEITVSGLAFNPQKPYCSDAIEIDINRGRWYSQEKHPIIPKETADEHGFSFDLDDCQLEYFDARDTIDCLAGKTIHVFGDSNARRLSRAILSGGRWCHNISHKCQGEDNGSPVEKVLLNKAGQVIETVESKTHKMQFEIGDHQPFRFGKASKLWFSFFTSVAYEPRLWLGKFYNPKDFDVPPKKKGQGPRPFKPDYILPNAHARPPHAPETADLAIISMSSWDDAFDVEYGAYEQTLAYYRDALMKAYPSDRTKLILRLNQGYCCRRNFRPANMRRFTGGRLQHFNDIARRVFQGNGSLAMQGRMRLFDIAALTGRPEVVRVYTTGQLSNNHQRAAHVRTEAQLLLNSVCTRDTFGKAIWKT